ncbi:hypothetical protein GH714_035484 [Hevea brasiliensis]|uniref:CHCH domain-containing protein n=1 Tax=Hevea brasiliensis TaxID=3981 RepID=A0A6A6NDV6_HEVBR|nr:hypothetical protein GH714_035484 [Hevea brasiliensis]
METQKFNEIVVDPAVLEEGPWPGKEQQLQNFAMLALQCTCDLEDNRPEIIDVAKQLRQITDEQPSVDAGICASDQSFAAHAFIPLLVASFVSFLLISHGYCIMCERLSATERRATAALGCVFYLTLVGYRASVPYFTVGSAAAELFNFILSDFPPDSSKSFSFEGTVNLYRGRGCSRMHDAVYTKYIMFKKFQGAMQIVAMAETVIYINVDTSSENYWLRLLVKEWAQFCILIYIGWTFRSQGLAPRFFVMPTIKSEGDIMVPPVYSIEMDATTFKDFNCNEWHIGVEFLAGGAFGGNRGLRPVPPEKGVFLLDHMHECDLEKKEYLNCLRSSGHQSENCRHFSKKYLECRMEKNLMARQDMSELGFEKVTDLEASGEKQQED